MSVFSDSVRPNFRNNDFDYQPLFEFKFVSDIYHLILKGKSKEVKKIFTDILNDEEKVEDYTNSIVLGDEYSNDEDYEGTQDDEESDDFCKLSNLILPNGFKLLMLSALLANSELLKFFIDLQLPVNCKDSRLGMTPLLAACSNKRNSTKVTECLRLLVDAGANLNSSLLQNDEHALHLLASNNQIQALEYLLPLSDNVDCRNDRRTTPLMMAAREGHLEVVRVLLAAGADRSMRNLNGMTAAEIAVAGGHDDVASLLGGEQGLLGFYRAWAACGRGLLEDGQALRIRSVRGHCKDDRQRQEEDLGYLCTNLGLAHLQPLLHRAGVTIADLRCVSDSELRQMGVAKFSDRRKLLATMQDVHRLPWVHEGSLHAPDSKVLLRPQELLDVLESAASHMELLDSSARYLCLQLAENPGLYDNQVTSASLKRQLAATCERASSETASFGETVAGIVSLLNQQWGDDAVEADPSCGLQENLEAARMRQKASSFPGLAKAVLGASCLCLGLLAASRGLKAVLRMSY